MRTCTDRLRAWAGRRRSLRTANSTTLGFPIILPPTRRSCRQADARSMERVRLDANKSCTIMPATAHQLRPRRSGPATRRSAMYLTVGVVVEAFRVIHPVDKSVEDVQTLLVRSREAIHEQSQSEPGLFIAAHVWPLAFVIHRCHFYLDTCGVFRQPDRGPPSSRIPAAPSWRRRPATVMDARSVQPVQNSHSFRGAANLCYRYAGCFVRAQNNITRKRASVLAAATVSAWLRTRRSYQDDETQIRGEEYWKYFTVLRRLRRIPFGAAKPLAVSDRAVELMDMAEPGRIRGGARAEPILSGDRWGVTPKV